MNRQILFYFLSFLLFFSFSTQTVEASSVSSPVVAQSQFFSPPDQNGNSGATDCMAAALSMGLIALATTEAPLLNDTDVSYATVRLTLRSASPDIRYGIAPKYLIAATPELTGNAFHLLRTEVDPGKWETFLFRELVKHYPVIVHVSDRNSLYDASSTSAASHVIVVSGMDDQSITFVDPWDGRIHQISKSLFATAWEKGYYHWLAFTFEKQPEATSFEAIINRRFNGHS